jgi:hypothetical protein
MTGFAIVMLGWPILSVSATGLAAGLTPIDEGAAMGWLAASNAIATVVGTILAGPLIDAMGYKSAAPAAIIGLSGAAALLGCGRHETAAADADEPAADAEAANALRSSVVPPPLRSSGTSVHLLERETGTRRSLIVSTRHR